MLTMPDSARETLLLQPVPRSTPSIIGMEKEEQAVVKDSPQERDVLSL